MTWARNTTTGRLTNTGSGRSVWRCAPSGGGTLPVKAQVQAGMTDITHGVKLCIRMSGDTRSCFEAGVEGANLIIRKVTFGAVGSALATIACPIAAATPFTLQVQLVGDAITVTAIVSSSTSYTTTYSSSDLRNLRGFGVSSTVDGAIVAWIGFAELIDRIDTVGEVGVAVIGGAVYATFQEGSNGNIWERIADAVFDPGTPRIGGAASAGKWWMVGGGRARVFDPILRTVTNTVPTAGTLPGDSGAGTTTATLIFEHLGGLLYAGMPENSVSIKGTAIGEPLNFDTSERLAGSAFELGVGRNVTVGDPILGISADPNNRLCVGCTNSLNFMIGSPYLGAYSLVTRPHTVGPAGPDAFAQAAGLSGEGLLVMLAPEGLHICPVDGAPIPISHGVLRALVEFPREERASHTVVLLRDLSRRMLHIFVNAGTSTTTYAAYSEFTGKYQAGAPGFFPTKIPCKITAAAFIRGRPIMGTSEGKLAAWQSQPWGDESSIGAADVGVQLEAGLSGNIESTITLGLLDSAGDNNDTVLKSIRPILGSRSEDATVTIYGAVSAEEALQPSLVRRRALAGLTATPRMPAVSRTARAPALAVVFSATGKRIVYETCAIWWHTAKLSRFAGWGTPPSVGHSCTHPVAAAAPDVPPTGGGPGTRDPGGTSPPPPPPPAPPPIPWRDANLPNTVIDIDILVGGGNPFPSGHWPLRGDLGTPNTDPPPPPEPGATNPPTRPSRDVVIVDID